MEFDEICFGMVIGMAIVGMIVLLGLMTMFIISRVKDMQKDSEGYTAHAVNSCDDCGGCNDCGQCNDCGSCSKSLSGNDCSEPYMIGIPQGYRVPESFSR